MESRRAEQIDPFMFGYEYQYILLMFSITLFYTVVTPVILPVGLVFMCLKHFVDKVRSTTPPLFLSLSHSILCPKTHHSISLEPSIT